ncbi:hypothetical protein JYU34_019269 [Plutella xylostella]|uniref:Uncharacterized protein n=1 Tax=Plutella xylostella TaxID=51655 RepID=A0ABQ7Q076_PLUXY|nr:hypothetical protein JYU34_019269 [Plutella xylostella]
MEHNNVTDALRYVNLLQGGGALLGGRAPTPGREAGGRGRHGARLRVGATVLVD